MALYRLIPGLGFGASFHHAARHYETFSANLGVRHIETQHPILRTEMRNLQGTQSGPGLKVAPRHQKGLYLRKIQPLGIYMPFHLCYGRTLIHVSRYGFGILIHCLSVSCPDLTTDFAGGKLG